jgi:TRAP transporter TAXI family solute receptor
MKKSTVWLLVVMIIGLFLFGYEGFSSATEPLPRALNIGTHPVGNLANVFGTAIATVCSKYTPIQFKVKAVAGPTTWMPMIVTKEVDLGVLTSADAYPAYLGIETYDRLSGGKGFPIRLATIGPIFSLGTIVRGDGPIKTIQELKGLRVCGEYANVPSAAVAQEAHLANGGLTWNDVKVVPVPDPGASVKLVMDGRADAGWATIGMPVVRELATKRGARFLSLDTSPEALERKDKIHPYSFPYLIKAGSTPGVDVDTWLMGTEYYVVCYADLPDNVIFEINKVLWDHLDEVWSIHPTFKSWNQKSFVSRKLFTPYHSGAIKFLKEKGIWSDKLEARQRELIGMKKK